MLRHLLTVVVLLIAHPPLSVMALMAYAAAMSPGCDWIARLICTIFFFPVLVLDMASVEVVVVDSPLGSLINSTIWVGVVYPLWIFCGWVRGQLLRSAQRIEQKPESTRAR